MTSKIRKVTFPEVGATAACACHDASALFELRDRRFEGQFDGTITAHIGSGRLDSQGRPIVPLSIVGYSTTSDVPGMGRTTLDFDFSRPVRDSHLRGNQPGVPFPGTQTMYLNILVTSEAFRGRVLQSRRLGTLVNRSAEAFPPPPGSVYSLVKPVELVDPKDPKTVLGRLLRVNTGIVSTDMAPKEFNVGFGVQMLAALGSFDRLPAAADAETPVAFRLAAGGRARIDVTNRLGKARQTVFEGDLEAGEHRIAFDTRKFRGRDLYFELFLDGQRRSGRMPLLIRS